MLRKFWVGALLFLTGLSGLTVPGAVSPALASAMLPHYEKGPCVVAMPTGVKVECGTLVVPEDRASKSTRTVRIAVAVVRATHPRADPIVFLNGGPGGYTLKNAARIIDTLKSFIEDRDLILFDQRGIGYSAPALECPEVGAFYQDSLTQNIASLGEQLSSVAAVRACHDRLSAQGIPLAAYTTSASAADVNDLRTVLGYRTWNLYGVSYGTRLALIVMRSFPGGIHSVVLDSTIPPQISPLDGSIPDAFDVLFEHCKQDSHCNTSYPDLKLEFYHLVTGLTFSPVNLSVADRATGKLYKVLLTGAGVIEGFYLALYQSAVIPRLPQMIHDAASGDYTSVGQLILSARLFDSSFGSLGAAYSVGCSEHLDSPLVCRVWNVPQTAHANDPVISSLPTLVLSGEFDPVTPPSYGQATAKTLAHSFFFEFTGIGHGVGFADACPRTIMQAFLDAPAHQPDASCISRMTGPAFVPSDF